MSHEFQNGLYNSSRAMCKAIAAEWITAGGLNKPSEIDAMTSTPDQLADECINAWGLDQSVSEDGKTWIQMRDTTRDDIVAGMTEFMQTRPDRNTAA